MSARVRHGRAKLREERKRARGTLLDQLRRHWGKMLDPDWHYWRYFGLDFVNVLWWLVSWVPVLAGVLLGALVAPSLIKLVGLSEFPFQYALNISIAVLTGFLVQFISWVMLVATSYLEEYTDVPHWLPEWLQGITALLWSGILFGVGAILPFAAVVYAIYRYLVGISPDERVVSVAFVGGLLVKAFVIPAIVGAIKSKAFKWFMHWLTVD